MFGRDTEEFSTISDLIEKKSKLLKKKKNIFVSKIDQVLHGEHEHYFCKKDVLSKSITTRCKVCGILLSEFKVQQKILQSSPLLKNSKPRKSG